jgi:hypothetical protein
MTSGCGLRKRPSDMQSGSVHVQQIVADSQLRLILQLGGCAQGLTAPLNNELHVADSFLRS